MGQRGEGEGNVKKKTVDYVRLDMQELGWRGRRRRTGGGG